MQKIIFKKDNKSLKKINNITLFEGEENADYLEIIIPQKYNDIDISTCNIRLIYITSDNYENSFLIDEYKQDILYKDNFLYLINIDERFTSVVGKIQMYLIFSKSDEKDILFKSGVATMFIKDHPSGNNELTENELYIIDQVVLISNKALKKAESVEQRADNGEFFPTIEITETEDGHNVTFKTTKQEETVELQNGKDYVLTNTDKTDIAQEVVEVVTPNIDEQVVKAEEILNEKAIQKADEINVSLDEHKEIIIGDINTVANNNIDNINVATNTNIKNINNITNNAVGETIPQAKDSAILEISNVKTNTLNDIANQKNIVLGNIVNRENLAISNLSQQESTLANNLNENANQHIININNKAEEKISEIDSKVTNIQERADNGEFNGKDGYTPQKGVDYFDGEKGDTYTITEADYEAIANITKELVKVIDDNKDSGSDTTWSTDKIKLWLTDHYPTYSVMNNTIEEFLNNYYTITRTDEKLALKQDVLTAGDNITIEDNVISSTVPDVDLSDYVKFTDTVKNDGTAGVVRVNNGIYGVKNVESGIIGIVSANDKEIETQASEFRAITPKNIKKAVETIGGNNVKPWRLIQNIDVTEELGSLNITVDFEGNPFEVDDIYIEMTNILGKNGSNLIIIPRENSTRPSTYVGGVVLANPISSTTKRHFFITFTRYMGLNKYKIEAVGKNATAYSNVYTHILPSNSVVISDSYKIREIQIYFSDGNYITSGNIKIYGR